MLRKRRLKGIAHQFKGVKQDERLHPHYICFTTNSGLLPSSDATRLKEELLEAEPIGERARTRLQQVSW